MMTNYLFVLVALLGSVVDGGDLSCDLLEQAVEHDRNRIILIEFFEGSPMYSSPGSNYKERVYITNVGTTPVNVTLTHRENFIRGQKHTELVRGIQPLFIYNFRPQETKIVEVNIAIPDYVQIGAQSKITLMVQNINFMRNSGLEVVERSFFFTVSNGPLTLFDRTPPDCGTVLLCPSYDKCQEKGKQSLCNETNWTGLIRANDNLTGLYTIEPTTQGVKAKFLEPILLGTRSPTTAMVEASCCSKGVEILMVDLAENTAVCVLGQIPSSTERATSISFQVISFVTILVCLAQI